jgi:NADH:ubiquinone oxidoreductase subunit E
MSSMTVQTTMTPEEEAEWSEAAQAGVLHHKLWVYAPSQKFAVVAALHAAVAPDGFLPRGTHGAVARAFGLSASTVAGYAVEEELYTDGPSPTVEAVCDELKRHGGQLPRGYQKELAQRLGVSKARISAIVCQRKATV